MQNIKFKGVKSKFVEETKSVFEFGQKVRGKWQAIFLTRASS